MTVLRSLRGRVMMGAVLWTLGLLAMSTMLWTINPRAMLRLRAIHSHNLAVGAIAVACMVGGLALVRGALSPLDEMRRRLLDLRKGDERQLRGSYPTEVQPLVDDLNALLDHRERAMNRALARAGDLAHGLKTPLAVLSQEAERADAAGLPDLAGAIAEQVERMRRQTEYHLAHARAAASGASVGARCSVATSADALAWTLARLNADRGPAIDIDVDAAPFVRVRREDLDEMLGNVLDNACKWARSRVAVHASAGNGTVVITVDDDGPGVEPALWHSVVQRGVRADEAAPGSGFGLAITRELAELYGGSISLGHAPIGGLRVTLELPSV